jgi:hypothetical protein
VRLTQIEANKSAKKRSSNILATKANDYSNKDPAPFTSDFFRWLPSLKSHG